MAHFTPFGWSVCLWLLLVPFQYGYHISLLNQIHAALTCESDIPPPSTIATPSLAPSPCVAMSEFTFSILTSIFTIGGLLGSLFANKVMDSYGRRTAARLSSALFGLGAFIMLVSNTVAMHLAGRFLAGLGAGVGLCVGPVYLSEITPPRIKGNVGVLTQLAIVLGIFITQSIGLNFATPTKWRFVLLFSFAIALVQVVASILVVDSPAWLKAHRPADGEDIVAEKRLWVGVVQATTDIEVRDPLLDEPQDQEGNESKPSIPSISVLQLLRAPELRKPLLIVSLAMISQQFSGVNAVLYYSNAILSKTLPDIGPYVSLGVTIVNVIMTFPTVFLIERTGRRKLLQISTIGSVVSLLCVGFGLDMGWVSLPSVAILTFIMSFAVGLGPVPFVMIPEVSPFHAVSAISAVALSLNWITNFLVGLVFLPLRSLLSGNDPLKEGRVFYVFAGVLAVGMMSLLRVYRG